MFAVSGRARVQISITHRYLTTLDHLVTKRPTSEWLLPTCLAGLFSEPFIPERAVTRPTTHHQSTPNGNDIANPTEPIIVIGAGPVGQTAALLLARWGLPVALLDGRAQRDQVGSKAIVQQRDVLDIWDSVGAGAAIARRGITWTTARTFHHDRELFAVTFADAGHSPFPPFVNISQAETEQILDERIAAQPLIEVRWGHRVTSITQDGSGVTVRCHTGGDDTDVHGSYAIACSGAQSEDVRAMLGLTFDGTSFDDRFLICDIRADLPGWQTERRFYFDPPCNPGRQVLIHPCPDSTYRIDWQVPPDFDLTAEEASGGLDRRIRAVIGERPYDIVWKSVYRFHSRLVDRMRVGRILIAGDAAHLMAPFGARGLNSGVQDVENAAWKLAFVLRGWAGDTLLESYHTERHAAAVENLDVTTATMRFLVPGDDAQRRYRQATLAAADLDLAARARVDSGRLAEPFWYTESPLTTPDERRPFSGRPARGTTPNPAPGIIVPDCPIIIPDQPQAQRLRQWVRTGITVLAGSAVPIREICVDQDVAVVRSFDELDPTSTLTSTLSARDDEVWIIRPDGHIAAILTDPTQVGPAISRLLGHHPARHRAEDSRSSTYADDS
jgi:2-polyprenyl-6-methoxyphenol hydroxylase-like FAD-dependent oxidoreductase